ncbi:MAG: DNA helicase PcrA [Clostridia bacterium]|nr:DNA helicase PcrA [Clostridia bacterium]
MIDLTLLNPEQKLAVTTTEGPLLVLAGAGSGKTRVLTYRVAHLIEKGVPAWAILAITFTNKAAREMRERVSRLSGASADDAWVMTFHACCARILRRDIEKIGFKREFVIYDDDDQMTLIKRILKQLEINDKNYPPRSVKAVISDAKNRMLSPEEWYKENDDMRNKAYYRAYAEYEKQLKSNNALDFDDLILKTLLLFSEHPPVLESYQRRFSYILVDEYQDTNMAQYMLVKLLAGDKKNVCVVGDDDQSIYAWRGADIRNILEFEKDYGGCPVIKLEQNYRSTSNILDAANQVIAHNTGRKEKALWTNTDAGDKIRLYHALDERDEAAWVCENIHALERRGLPLGDIAILYRTNAQSRVLEEALVRRGIKYGVYGGLKFYDRKEVKDVLAYLRLLVNPDDDVSFRRIINEPRRGIGDATVEAIASYAQQNGLSMVNAVLEASEIGLSGRALNAVSGFADILMELTGEMLDVSASELIEEVLEKTGILTQYKNSKDDDDKSRVENIQELVSAVTEYDKQNPEEGILGFLENVALVTDTDSMEEKVSFVTLMTLHSAKGLEFPAVFLTGLEEGIFPISRAMFDEDQLEEERRLMYVGITRAKKILFVSHAKTRMLYNARQANELSRFVSEMPGRVIEDNRIRASEARLQRPMARPQYDGGFSKPSKPGAFSSGKPSLNNIPGLQKGFNYVPSQGASQVKRGAAIFHEGDYVQHRTLGKGVVKAVRDLPEGTRVDVDFGAGKGVRTFAADTAPMIKIG